MRALLDQAPKVLILSYRTTQLMSVMFPLLRDSYFPVFTNVLITGRMLPPTLGSRFRIDGLVNIVRTTRTGRGGCRR